jgi:hypothetical protein
MTVFVFAPTPDAFELYRGDNEGYACIDVTRAEHLMGVSGPVRIERLLGYERRHPEAKNLYDLAADYFDSE